MTRGGFGLLLVAALSLLGAVAVAADYPSRSRLSSTAVPGSATNGVAAGWTADGGATGTTLRVESGGGGYATDGGIDLYPATGGAAVRISNIGGVETHNAGRISAAGDVEVPTNSSLYLNGSARSIGFKYDASVVRFMGNVTLLPNADLGSSLGSATLRWSRIYVEGIHLGVSGAHTFMGDLPTGLAACTTPTRTHGNLVSFQADVGTGCLAGNTTLAFTVPATTNGTRCDGDNISASATRVLAQSAGWTGTTVTMTNYSRTTGLAIAFADSEDAVINCVGR